MLEILGRVNDQMPTTPSAEPLISIVLPVYDGAAHLDAAVASVLGQTLRDFELLIIDDGSRDDSPRLARGWARRDARVRALSRENRGLVRTLNEGVGLARGRWIARMDADDVCAPGRLAAQLAWLRGAGADLCGGDIRTFGGGRRPKRIRHYAKEREIRTQLLFDAPFAHPTVVARRELLLAHPYDDAFRHAEDYELWTRLALKGARMTNCPEIVLHYRLHAAQVSAVASREQDASRRRAALAYRRALSLPDVPAAAFADMLDGRERLTPQRFRAAVDGYRALLRAGEDLAPNVLADNAFLFLARHADAGLRLMREAARGLPLPASKRALLLAMAASGLSPRGPLYALLKRAW
jgi:glycosyltransferase involved in cell wall biosynthesis